jgi:hypothetical protein
VISTRPGPYNLQGLPTLTEVIDLPARPRPAVADEHLAPPATAWDGASTDVGLPPPMVAEFNEQRLVQAVLNDLQRHADLLLEVRLREAMTPALARLTDQLVHELRQELAATLRDMVAGAVSQEVARQRNR